MKTVTPARTTAIAPRRIVQGLGRSSPLGRHRDRVRQTPKSEMRVGGGSRRERPYWPNSRFGLAVGFWLQRLVRLVRRVHQAPNGFLKSAVGFALVVGEGGVWRGWIWLFGHCEPVDRFLGAECLPHSERERITCGVQLPVPTAAVPGEGLGIQPPGTTAALQSQPDGVARSRVPLRETVGSPHCPRFLGHYRR
jgi:hypothetical protein